MKYAFAAATLVAVSYAGLIEKRQQCRVQSCKVAAISGSSGAPVTINDAPEGDTLSGDCCVLSYRPELAPLAIQFQPGLATQCPEYFVNVEPSNDSIPRNAKRAMNGFDAEAQLMAEYLAAAQEVGPGAFSVPEAESVDLEKRACKDKVLIYAKGTFEPGALGVTLGPKLKKALGTSWDVRGVPYDPTAAGDYCLGLPGGQVARKTIEDTVAACPNSLVALSGYSQGAMVVRNGLANSTVQSAISGIATFGDPFNGAAVYKYTGPIYTQCNAKDGVCGGEFKISAAHLSYSGDLDAAVAFLNGLKK